MQSDKLVSMLESRKRGKRLKAVKILAGEELLPEKPFSDTANVNYNFRTVYSDYDKTPSLCVYYAKKFGLPIASVADYASLKGATEFYKAEDIIGSPYYLAVEAEVKSGDEKFTVVAMGIPHKSVVPFDKKLAPFRDLRAGYVGALKDNLSARFSDYGITVSDYKIKKRKNGAPSVGDLYSFLAEKIMEKFKKESAITAFLTDELYVPKDLEDLKKTEDFSNPLYKSDLAAILSEYVKADDVRENLADAHNFVSLCHDFGAICCFEYKGEDVNDFVNKAVSLGGNAVSVNPEVYGEKIAEELYSACVDNNVLPVSRIVVDNPRKKFDYEFSSADLAAKYRNTAAAIVGHEISATLNFSDGFFSARRIADTPDMEDRIKLFAAVGFHKK